MTVADIAAQEQASAWPDFCNLLRIFYSGVSQRTAPLLIPMSTCKPVLERAVSHSEVTHTVNPSAAPKAPLSPAGAVAQEVVCLRKAEPIDRLLPGCINWLASLPEQVRPSALANQYPQIANVLALDWCRHEACQRYFDDVLIEHRRGTRQGFPVDVHRELETLRDYYDTHHPLA